MSNFSPNKQGFYGVNDYLHLPREAQTYLMKPLIPTAGACLLYGAPKLGKSYLGIQLALAISGQTPDFMGFPVTRPGKVLYLQLDTPRSVWAQRFEDMIVKGNLKYDSSTLLLGDRETFEHFPFDILQPAHMKELNLYCQMQQPVAVVVDTLRELHSGDEDNSTTARNVIANLVGATSPAALILISHDRKPNPDRENDIMADHRGSSYITGRMDAILRLTKNKLYYAGRSIEAGDIRMERMDNGLWKEAIDEYTPIIMKVMADPTLHSWSARARVLAPLIHKSEEAAKSLLRRRFSDKVIPKSEGIRGSEIDISNFGEVVV